MGTTLAEGGAERFSRGNVRIGVIGTGIMGADHARILARDVSGADVTMLADSDIERARTTAETIPLARVTDSALELIQAPDVDAVLIASSDATHAEFVFACLQARKPVLCEKPLAPTAEECLAIVQAEAALVSDGPHLVSVGFMRRFDQGYVELKSLLASDSLGVPLMLHSTHRVVSAPQSSAESALTGAAVHDFDIAAWLIGSDIVEATWFAPRSSVDGANRQDPQFLVLRTADNVLVTVDLFVNAHYGYDVRCEVVGSRGAASLSEPSPVVLDVGRVRGQRYSPDWRPRFADAYRRQAQAWVDSLVDGTPSPLATATDGLKAALVSRAAIESMRSGRTVPVSTWP